MKSIYSIIYIFLFAFPLQASQLPSLAVVVTKSPGLSPQEISVLHNIVAEGFEKTDAYRIVDAQTIDKMLEDEVTEALLLGNEEKLDEIQMKYRVDVLVSLAAEVESIDSLGGYSLASASVTIGCRRNDSAMLFDLQTSEPQNGYHGMPEWLGATREAARNVALRAAIASAFSSTGLETVEFPFPQKFRLSMEQMSSPAHPISFFPSSNMSQQEAGKLAKLTEPSIGRRDKVTCSVLDGGKRIGAVAVTGIDIDLQRNRRIDTAGFEVFDLLKKRSIRKVELPRVVEGIRRPRSRDIVDIAFAPTGRFVSLISKHPAVWLYDNFSGELLAAAKLPNVPKKVFISDDGKVLKIFTGRKDLFFQIVKE